MIKDDFVSFETAKQLKEKGFDVECDYAYNNKGDFFKIDKAEQESIFCYMPTIQLAAKWLREKYRIYIENHITKNHIGGIDHWCKINTINDLTPFSNKSPFISYIIDSVDSCNTYEQAIEAAIAYSLKNIL